MSLTARRLHSFLGAGLAVICMEAAVRTVYQLPVAFEPGFGNIIRPGATVIWGREGHGVSRWTHFGIRRESLPRDFASGRSILVLGNSNAEALQVSDEVVFTTLLERRLADLKAPVLNMGRQGTPLAEHVAFAGRNQETFNPRWTILLLGTGDLGSRTWIPGLSHFERDDGGRLIAKGRALAPRSPWRARLSPLVNGCMLLVYGVVRKDEFLLASASQAALFNGATNTPVARDRDNPEGDVESYPIEEELDLLSEAYRGRITFLLLPRLSFKEPRRRGAAEERIEAHCAARGLSCVNPRPLYPGLVDQGLSPFGFPNESFNEGHMNSDGHRIVAEVLALELRKILSRELR